MNDNSDCPRVGVDSGGAPGGCAGAGKLLTSGGQGPQCVGAALGDGAGVVFADLMGHLGESAVQHGRVGG